MTMPRISQKAVLWMLMAATLALLGFFVALFAGAIPIDDPGAPFDTRAVASSETESVEETTPTVTKSVSGTTPTTTTTATTTTTNPALTTVVVTAARGDCWISARLGSEDGRVLDERLLARGESITLRGARVWISIGASGNVDVTVNGEDRELQSGTVAVVLGPT